MPKINRELKYGRAEESNTTRACKMLASGCNTYETSQATGLTRRYVEILKRGVDNRAHEAAYAGEFALRAQNHADALISQGGFHSLSERCVGYDATGNRRMVACLPLIPFTPPPVIHTYEVEP